MAKKSSTFDELIRNQIEALSIFEKAAAMSKENGLMVCGTRSVMHIINIATQLSDNEKVVSYVPELVKFVEELTKRSEGICPRILLEAVELLNTFTIT